MRIISIANQKGGCGKTTTAINVSACLAFKGQKVLLIDMDPQGHAAMGLNIDTNELERTIYDVLGISRGVRPKLDDITIQVADSFYVAPSHIALSALEQDLSMARGRDTKLKEAIEGSSQNYDYVVIDCPPSLGLLTFNSLMASTEVFIPIEMGMFSLHGTGKLLEIIDLVRNKTGHEIRVKVIATMFDRRTRIAHEVLQDIKNHFEGLMFKTVINTNVSLKEAASFGKSIVDYATKSKGYGDYMSLTKEVVAEGKKLGVVRPAQIVKQFFFHAPEANSVRIVGNFNNWIPTKESLMERSQDGTWSKAIPLSPGKYQYRFLVDDIWVEDQNNPSAVENPFGGKNSIIEVS